MFLNPDTATVATVTWDGCSFPIKFTTNYGTNGATALPGDKILIEMGGLPAAAPLYYIPGDIFDQSNTDHKLWRYGGSSQKGDTEPNTDSSTNDWIFTSAAFEHAPYNGAAGTGCTEEW